MSNVISTELFKLKKDRSMFIMVLINIAMTVLVCGIFNFVVFNSGNFEESVANLGKNSPVEAFSGFYQVIVICLAVLAGTFICGEFDSGCIKNSISIGKRRTHYYFAKFYSVIVSAMIFMLITTIIYTVFMTVRIGWGEASGAAYFLNLFLFVFCEAMIYMAYTAIFVMVAFLLRSVGGTIGLTISFSVFESLAVQLLSLNQLEKVSFLRNAFPYYSSFKLRGIFYAAESNIDYLWIALICLAIITVTTFIGVYSFIKRDIK